MRSSIRDLYEVETDGTDWPRDLTPEAKTWLQDAVRRVLAKYGALSTSRVLEEVKRLDDAEGRPWDRGALWDWQFGCVTRALRAIDADQKWHLPT